MRIALAVLLVAAVGFALAGIVPGSSGRLAGVSVGQIVLAVLAEIAALIAYSVLFWAVFGPGEPAIGLVRSAQIAIGELGAYVIVPTGAGGPVLRVWALLASGMRLPRLLVRSVIHAVAFNLPYIVVALILGIGVLLGLGPGRAPTLVALAPVGVLLAASAVATGATVYVRRHGQAAGGRWGRLGMALVAAIPDGLRQTPGRLRDPLVVAGSVGYWAGDCGVLVLAFHAVHGSPPIGVIVLAYLLGQLGNALPLPGGVGGVEPLMLGVLTASGVAVGLAAAAIVLYRFVSLGLQALTGSVAVLSLTPVLETGSGTAAEQLR